MKLLLRFFGFLFAAGTILFVVGIAAAAGLLWHFSKDLPDYSQLQDYEPPVMTRVHAADGSLVAEYARERRLYIPIQAVPKMVINAFLAAEDKNFYEHGGLDFPGIARAAVNYLQNYGSSRRPQGASTITQQVAKNFLLTNELSIARKMKEALLALKIERTYSKDKILELYLNEIYLGLGAYGVAAASLVYFDKAVNELTVPEAAFLAALPKAPNNYHPFRQRERAIERRNWVLDRMAEAGFDPTLVVGGRVTALGSNARLGQGEFLVAEADESDGSFLRLTPTIAVVTTIDAEHLDYYRDLTAIREAFLSFVSKVPFYGAAVLCADQPEIQAILPRVEKRVITYGLGAPADLVAASVRLNELTARFEVLQRGDSLGELRLQVPGLHNVANALAACAAAMADALGEAAGRVHVEVVDEIDSTSSRLLERGAAGAPPGTCLAAEWQNAGRAAWPTTSS